MSHCKRLLRSVQLSILAVLLSALALGAQATAAASTPPVFEHDLAGFGNGTIPLDGPWQFHLGDDPRWAAPALDDRGWEQLTADKQWGLQGHPAQIGYAWYRCHIRVHPGPGAPDEMALLIPRVFDAYEVYWNGRLIGGFGKLPPHPLWYLSLGTRPAVVYPLGAAQDGVLAVRVWKAALLSYDDARAGGFLGLPVVGDPVDIANQRAALDYRWLSRNQFNFVQSLLYTLVFLLGLILWLRDRRETLPLWMAGFAFEIPAVAIFTQMRLPLSSNFCIFAEQPVIAFQDLSLWLLLLRLLRLSENPRLARFVRIAAVVQILSGTLDGLLVPLYQRQWRLVSVTDWTLTVVISILEFLPVLLVIWAVVARKRLTPSRWVLAGAAFLAGGINDLGTIVEQGRQYTQWAFYDRLQSPILMIGRSAITIQTLADTLLLFALLYAVYGYMVEERRRQAALAQEIKNARELQQVLIPEALPTLAGYALTSTYRPAQEVGGDFFQVVPIEGATLIVLGDVSGKGLPAAMTVALVVGAVRTLAEITRSPAELLEGLNRRLCGRLRGGFATCLALRLGADGSGAIACAGHPAPYLNGREIELPGALPLGIERETAYEERPLHLDPTDNLALYTDGLLEARNEAGELYGFDRMQSLFERNQTAASAEEVLAGYNQEDDITVLTLTRLKAGEEATARYLAPAV